MEPVVSRALIHEQADFAALRMARASEKPTNPYPQGSAAANEWKRCLERRLLWHSAPQQR